MEYQWYDSALIYHAFSLSLMGAPYNNDYSANEHRLSGVEKWIPHIKGMGFNTLLFSPVLKSKSHGYDVTDYFEIDNRLGTNAEFQSLVKILHENEIRVVLDSVFNHCGRDFFAFAELRNGNNDFKDWFSGVDFTKQSPAGDPFIYDTWGGHFELPKFNLQNDSVKKYLLDNARFLIDTFDIDGMRLDAANVLDFNFMRELRRVTCEKKPDFWLMGEVVHGDYSKWVNADALHSVTNYKLHKSLISSHNDNNLYELMYSIKNAVPDNGLSLQTFLDNHDIARVASSVNNQSHLYTLYALLFTLPGIPSVYYGSEWGFEGKKEAYSDQNLRPFINIDERYKYDRDITGHISRLLKIRQKESALKWGSYEQIYWEYRRPLVFERSYENDKVLVAVNIFENYEVINLSKHGSGFFDLLREERIEDSYNILLKPHSARIMKMVN